MAAKKWQKPYCTDSELEELLQQSDDEDIAQLPDSDDGWDEESDSGTTEPAYVPPDSSESSESSDLDENQASIVTPPPSRKKQKVAPKFIWKEKDLDPHIHNFDSSKSGCTASSNLRDGCTELDCFQIFFGEDIMQYIVKESNRYFQHLSSQDVPDKSRLSRWCDTDVPEMYCFVAVNFLMAQVKKNVINEYWSNDFLTATPMFGKIMSRDRFLLLLRMLHFVDNNENAPEEDKIWKIRRIVDHLKEKMKINFYPFNNLCIDESLVLFKGRVFFKQYIPSKRHRFGIKFFLLCDCETGFILDFIIYTGQYTELEQLDKEILTEIGVTGNVVLTLMRPYLGNGHSLFLDNWYVSPGLFTYLHERKKNACGTVKKNRKGMPKLDKKLPRGDVEFKTADNMLALKWQDKREVRMLTTMHDSEVIGTGKIDRESGEEKKKPHCIMDYNQYMGAVDRSDMMLSSTECVRRSIKWYKKVFFHLLDISMLNSHALYLTISGKKITLAHFQRELIEKILQKYHKGSGEYRKGRRSSQSDHPLRLTARHFPSLVPPTRSKPLAQIRCVVCASKGIRKDSRYMCKECKVGLCIINCFERYHTFKNY